MPDPVLGPFDDIVQGAARPAAPHTAAPGDDPFADLIPPAPRQPLPIPEIPTFAADATAARGRPGPTMTPLDVAKDVVSQGARGLAESGYGTAQGVTNLLGLDRAADAVRQSRQEMREFYGDPETGLGTAAGIAGGIVGTGAQFMVPGAALTRAAAIPALPAGAATAMRFLANPLGGAGVRAAAGRMVGGALLNTPLNAALAASPEDASATFLGEITDTRSRLLREREAIAERLQATDSPSGRYEIGQDGIAPINAERDTKRLVEIETELARLEQTGEPFSDAMKRAGQSFPAAFAVETGVDLLGNAAVEGIAAGVRRARGRPAFPAPEPIAPTPPAEAPAEGGIRRKIAGIVDPSVRQLEEQRNVAQRAAETDALTGLGNQGAYSRALASAEADPNTAVLRFDANGFKGVNDALGHDAGDAALKEMAAAIQEAAGPGARVFRVGGDEFAVLAPKAEAEAALQRIEQAYGVRDIAPGVRTSLTGGFGETGSAADAMARARKPGAKAEQGIPERGGINPFDDIATGKVAPSPDVPNVSVEPNAERGTFPGSEGTTVDARGAAVSATEPPSGTVRPVTPPTPEQIAPSTVTSPTSSADVPPLGPTRTFISDEGISPQSRASDAGTSDQKSTTTTTPDPSMSGGSVGPAISPSIRGASSDLPPDAPAPRPALKPVSGPTGRALNVTFSDGSKLKTRYRVIEAGDLISSHNPESFQPDARYPEGVQGRDYARDKAAQEVVAGRALKLDPDLALDATVSAEKGAPVITPDGLVIVGNERSMLLRRAPQERRQAYRNALTERAREFGLDPATVSRMKNPVLVREITDPSVSSADPRRLGALNRLSDTPDTKVKRVEDDAASRATQMRGAKDALEHYAATIEADETLADYLGRAEGKAFVRKLVDDGVFAPQELARYADAAGALTEEGKTAIRRVMLAAAVDNPASLSSAPPAILNKLEHAVPHIVTTRGVADWDLGARVQGALDLLTEARQKGIKLADLLDQGSMFGSGVDPEAARLAQFLDRKKKGEITEAFRKYGVRAREAAGRAQSEDMFGNLAAGPEEVRGAVFASPMGRGGRSRASDPQTTFATIFDLDAANARATSKISPEEMASRRDELGNEARDIPGADDPDQGAFFNPGNRPSFPPPPPPSGGAAAAASSPSPAPKPRLGDRLTPQQEMASEIVASALGGVVGSATAGEDNRGWGFVVGMAASYGGMRALLAGVKGAAKRAAVREGAKTLRQINLEMMRAAGVSVRQGRSQMLRQSALGWYNTATEAIRVQKLSALDIGAHELGHHISKTFFGNPTNKRTSPRTAPKIPLSMAEKRELVAAGKRLYGNRKPTGGYGEEGIAEFFKFYVTDPARAKAEFPLTYNKFVQALDSPFFEGGPPAREILDVAQGQYQRWKDSPAYDRVMASISIDERATVRPTLADFRRIVEDNLFPAKKMSRELRALGAKVRGDEIDPYEMMILSRGSAGEAARSLEDGIVIGGRKVADGIEETLRAVRDRNLDFELYLKAKRVLDDLLPRGIEKGISKAEAQAIVRRLEPEFKAHAEKIWAFQNAKIRLRQSVGKLTKEQADEIIKANPHHVPLQVVFDADELASARGGGRGLNSSGVQRIKGSERRTVSALESIVRDTYDTYRQVREHDAARRLLSMGLRTEGGSRWVERVEAPKVPQSFRLTPETIEQLVDMGVMTADQAADISGPMMTGQLAGFLEGFTDAQRAGMREGKDLVFPMLDENGKRIWVEVKDPQVYEAFLGMNTEQQSALERFIAKWPKWAQAPLVPAKATARTLRAGATLTAEFIARNPVRDAWGAMVRTRAGRVVLPGEHLFRGVSSLIKKDLDYDAWLRSGGANATMVSGDRSVYQKALRDFQATAAERGWYLVRHPVDFMRAVSEIAENATRLGEFKMVRQRALKDGMTGRQAELTAAAAARDITVDFAKAGQAVREANKIVAFLNAYVQGNINLAKDLVNRPAVVLPRILVGVTLPSLALEALFHDNETYQEVPNWMKQVAWVIPMGSGPDAPYIAIPKPFELGTLFGTIPQRILNHYLTDDPKQLERVRGDLVKAFTPPVVPTIAAPLIENFSNRSLFTDRPIVPRDREGEEPFAQASPRTGETARLAGRITNTSPAKLENIARGYTGGLGTSLLQVPDAAIRIARERTGREPLKVTPTRDREGIFGAPGIRAFVKPAPGMDSESVERFYADRDASERKRQTWQGLQQEGRFEEASRYLVRHLPEILAMGTQADFGGPGVLRQGALQMTDLREMRRSILSSGMPKAERDEALRGIEQAMKEVARGSNAAMQALTTGMRQ